MKDVLTFLRLERLKQGLSQEAFADHMGITGAAWSKIERGETELTLSRLFAACETLQIDPITALMANSAQRRVQAPLFELSEVDFTLRKHLIELAYAGETIDYVELVERYELKVALQLHMGWEKLGVMLSNICLFEFAESRPLLSVLVIDKDLGEPRYGFYNLARDLGLFLHPTENEYKRKEYYRSELHKTFRHWHQALNRAG